MPALTVSKRPDRTISLPTVSCSATHSRDLAERLEAKPSKNDRRSRVSAAVKFGGERSVERTAIGPLCRATFSMHVSGRQRIGTLAKAAPAVCVCGPGITPPRLANTAQAAKAIYLKYHASD
jgi:hypothetical protein